MQFLLSYISFLHTNSSWHRLAHVLASPGAAPAVHPTLPQGAPQPAAKEV